MTSILALALLTQGAAQAKPVTLARKFKQGEKMSYSCRADFVEEQRSGSLQVLIPQDESVGYHYTMTVQKMKADDVAEILYQRPSMEITMGDSAEEAAKTMTEKVDFKLLLDVSPVNDIVAEKDLNPPKKAKDGFYRNPVIEKIMRQGNASDRVALGLLFSYKDEIQRLAFFVGPLDSGLDISPKFPFDEVNVGTTWKSTVGYTPQKLKDSGGKSAVQRIDYTYTYMGLMKDKTGKDVHRIQAKTKVETDLIEYARQLVGGSASSSFLKSVPLGYEATIDFDLDPANCHLLRVAATSSGHFEIEPKGGEQALLENKFKGKTKIVRDGYAILPATSATTPPKGGSKVKGGGKN